MPRLRRAPAALLVLVSASLAVALAPVAVATAAAPRIAGSLQTATMSTATHLITLSGWAEDMDHIAISPVVSMWIDGRYVRAVAATQYRDFGSPCGGALPHTRSRSACTTELAG